MMGTKRLRNVLCPSCGEGDVEVVYDEIDDPTPCSRKTQAYIDPHVACPYCHKRWKKVEIDMRGGITFIEED